jgi:hypothetical protein
MSLILSGTDGLSDVDGSAATPAIRGTDANTGIFFPAADTIAFSEGGVEAMRIDSSGQLGIATSSPRVRLDVRSDAVIAAPTPLANAVASGVVAIGDTVGSVIGLQLNGSSYDTYFQARNMGAGSTAYNMLLQPLGGNLLVNTTTRSNDEKLTVFQSGSAMGISVRTTGGPALGNYESADSTRAAYWTFGRDNASTGNFVFGSGGTLRATIDTSGGLTLTGSTAVKATGTAWTNPSDQRLKDNICDYAKGLTELMQIRVCEWEFNGKGGTVEGMKGLGVIADEVMTVLPNTVENYDAKLNADDEETTAIKKFDATEITWLLVKTVQEQQALIIALTNRIAVLEAK